MRFNFRRDHQDQKSPAHPITLLRSHAALPTPAPHFSRSISTQELSVLINELAHEGSLTPQQIKMMAPMQPQAKVIAAE
jgi:hypothetical protein